MKTFITIAFAFSLFFLLNQTPSFAGGVISFQKFNQVFGYRSKYSVAKKDKLIKKLNGKRVEWKGTLTGKFFHFSQVSLSMDMGPFAGPKSVTVELKRSQKEKLMEINKGSIVKVRAKINGYGKVKFHKLVDGVVLDFKQKKGSEKDFDARDIRFRHLKKNDDKK